VNSGGGDCFIDGICGEGRCDEIDDFCGSRVCGKGYSLVWSVLDGGDGEELRTRGEG
jgi:hypothetical protein